MMCRSPSRPNASGRAPLLIGSNSAPARSRSRGAVAVALEALGRGDDYYRSRVERREHPRRGGRPQPPIEQDPRQRAAAMHLARRQQRIVGEDGSRAHGDGIDFRPHRLRMPKRIIRADARTLPGLRRHAIVDARRRLHDDERPLPRLEREVGAVQPERTLPAGADRHVDALLTQKIEPATAHARIGVDRWPQRRARCRLPRCVRRTDRFVQRASRARGCSRATRRARAPRPRRARAPRRAVRPRCSWYP